MDLDRLSRPSARRTHLPEDPAGGTTYGSRQDGRKQPVAPARCPFAPPLDEFRRIEERYPLLSSTGCTANFCQSGRMVHTDEPRVGRDRSLSVAQNEAVDFLCQLRRDGIIKSDESLHRRKREAVEQLQRSSRRVKVARNDRFPGAKDGDSVAVAAGEWEQSAAELEHGIRLAWKHSKKCIMRSEWKSLRLCDLRHVAGSAEMGRLLLEKAHEAFNNGDILPTVFVFPPRKTGQAGPMIWNHQLLSFAGYRNEDGSVLGDPLNAELTDAIIELGWTPPAFRTQWDLLPLVTMAEGDVAVITPIPPEMFPLVHIRHPHYGLQFDKLGLRWVPSPALSRLGFDIGGVQYTATPFMGWFMDAEIGVRDLVDRERYNILPRLIDALDLPRSALDLEEVPEYERLALLSRAQTELNFAVYWSFEQAGPDDVVLVIASSCGRGDMPYNGQAFMKRLKCRKSITGVKFAVYGNGSSSYKTSYNGAARSIERAFRERGGRAILDIFEGDTEKEIPPWRQLNTWWRALRQQIFDEDDDVSSKLQQDLSLDDGPMQAPFEALAARSSSVKLVSSTNNIKGIKHVVLDVGTLEYPEMSHIDIFIPNRRIKVEQVLAYMDLTGRELKLSGDITTQQFITELVDLERPFTDTRWASGMNLDLEQLEMLSNAPFPQALKVLPPGWRKRASLGDVFAAMPLLRPRTFSAASSQRFWEVSSQGNILELLVQTHPRGLFSERFLNFSPQGTSMRIRIRPTSGILLEDSTPTIAFATGSGIAPVRSLLQSRIFEAEQAQHQTGAAQPRHCPVSLFIGFKNYDVNVAAGTLDRASELGLLDMLFLTPSNRNRMRAQDKMFADGVRHRIVSKIKDDNANVFVCASAEAARDFAQNLSAILGRDVKDALAERYIEEVFDPTG
ncbi:putative nitric oxide synthase protein [Neofusicoccum parvum UCRNP2]|uniref:nitric-oxide synthase (NADPH) n=1 Tax=Botryosphaeria parva (strain UCR-NP2) TaxID=1287680 RepID=R1EMW6_BOTPV|nr:putative nitric oxide synthase protein [Neofusicoccum parvum UCRNP2]